jgi:hypothetical protein
MIFGDHKGTSHHLSRHSLCQPGKGCLGVWPWASSTPVGSIFQETPLHYGLDEVELSAWTFLSLFLAVLLRKVSPLENWGKAPRPLQLYGRLRKLGHQVEDYATLCGWNPTSVHQGFFFFSSP